MADKEEKNKLVPKSYTLVKNSMDWLTSLSIKDLRPTISVDVGDRLLISWADKELKTITQIVAIDEEKEEITTTVGTWKESDIVRMMNGQIIDNIQLIVEGEDNEQEETSEC